MENGDFMLRFIAYKRNANIFMKKIINIASSNQTFFVFIFPSLIFCLYGLKNLGLPGLYMDSVNPDYLSAWMQKGSIEIPAWIYPDNWIAGVYKFPLLNSLYGGNSPAYLGVVFFKIFGFGFVEVRLFHSLLGILLLIAMAWCLLKWRLPKFTVFLFVSLLASDPSYIYAWRTQFYIQLYPMIWFFIGLGLMGGFFYDKINKNHKVIKALAAGLFIGFSAYSYFIFAMYAGSVAILFLVATKRHGIDLFLYLIAGIFIGFVPFLYAHVSIILNTDVPTYISLIEGLQTAYGVVDVQQGGIIERLMTVVSRLEQLVFGKGVESVIFGSSTEAILPSFYVVGFLIFFIIFYRPFHFDFAKLSDEKQGSAQIYWPLLATLISISVLFHLIFGTIVGKPLQLQHYIMLIPLLYFLSSVLFSKIFHMKLNTSIYRVVKSIAIIITIITIVINIFSSHRISNRLTSVGGNGLYSDAINTTGLYLESLPPETALLFPQWGYWMGVVTITGPKHSVFYTPNLEEMESRLTTDPELINRSSFVLILGRDFFRGNDLNVEPRELAERNGLRLRDITTIHGRNNIDKIILLHLSRLDD